MSTTVTQDMSFLHLISSASLLVQLVMLILVMISLLSWWFIFRKLFVIRNEIKKTDEFEDVFWRGVDLNALYQRTTSSRYASGSLERIFAAGFSEFNKHPSGTDLDAVSFVIFSYGWIGQSLCRFIGNGMGDYEFFSQLIQHDASNHCARCARNCRSFDCNRNGFVCGDSRCSGL